MNTNNENAAVLKVDNLLFKRPCINDVEDLLAVKNDNEAAQLLGGVHHQYTEEDIANWIEFHNTKDDEVVFVVVDTETNHVIGHAGIYKIDKRIQRAEYGILIGSKNARGKGWGTKITNFMSDYCYKQLGLHKIKALVLKEKLPMINVISAL